MNIRKDSIIIDENLIGREVFFNKCDMSDIVDLTPNKRYKITNVDILPMIEDDADYPINVMLNTPSVHLAGRRMWKLAKRTSSKQKVVRTASGRRL